MLDLVMLAKGSTGLMVESYLELYTQFLGWAVYGIIWDLIKDTGLIYLPFIAIIWDAWIERLDKGSFESLGAVSFRAIVKNHVVAVFVLMVAAEPAMPINLSMIKMQPKEVRTYAGNALPDEAVTAGNSGTTYDDAFKSSVDKVEKNGGIKIPIFWKYVLNFSSGFSKAIIAGLPSQVDMRFLQNQVSSAVITDHSLSYEVANFTNWCYMNAHQKYHRLRQTASEPLNWKMVNEILDKYPDDLNWIGSLVLYKSQGLYAKSLDMNVVSDGYKPKYPIERFKGDANYDDARPYCDDWWLALRSDLLEHAKKDNSSGTEITTFDIVKSTISNAFNILSSKYIDREEAVENELIQIYLKNTREAQDIASDKYAMANTSYSASPDAISQNLAYAVKGLLAGVGSAKEGMVWSVKFYTVLLALPMIQAIAMFGFTIVLPFLLVFSKLSIKGVVYGFFAFFSLKLLTAFWGIASWFDNTLIGAMYPTQSAVGAFFTSANNEGTERILLDMMTTGMHIGIPLLYLGVMAAAGFQVASAISSSMEKGSESANRSGQSGGEAGKSAAKNAGKQAASATKRYRNR